jgi:Transposase IS200 like
MHALRDKRCRAPIAISFLDTSGTAIGTKHEATGNSPELTVQIVQLACPEFTEGFNRFPPFKTFERRVPFKDSGQNLIEVRTRSAPLFALGFRSKEAVRSIGAQLNYMVTSNHIHLVVKDTGANIIAESMLLIAGRTAQEFNQHKGKQGAFWEDRYHATAIESEEYLHRCLVYIDLKTILTPT